MQTAPHQPYSLQSILFADFLSLSSWMPDDKADACDSYQSPASRLQMHPSLLCDNWGGFKEHSSFLGGRGAKSGQHRVLEGHGRGTFPSCSNVFSRPGSSKASFYSLVKKTCIFLKPNLPTRLLCISSSMFTIFLCPFYLGAVGSDEASLSPADSG